MKHTLQNYSLGSSVAVFGSARIDEAHPHYAAALQLGNILGHCGINVLTGGGPGIMEAALRGCKDAGHGKAIGIRIALPNEDDDSVLKWHDITEDFSNFSARQCTLIQNSDAHCAFFGGYGTIFEIMEVLTLMQTGFLARRPVVLYGTEHWMPLIDFAEQLEVTGATAKGDRGLLYVTNDIDDMADQIINSLQWEQ
jgi:uncharacterized protein (TIGR00730 family)